MKRLLTIGIVVIVAVLVFARNVVPAAREGPSNDIMVSPAEFNSQLPVADATGMVAKVNFYFYTDVKKDVAQTPSGIGIPANGNDLTRNDGGVLIRQTPQRMMGASGSMLSLATNTKNDGATTTVKSTTIMRSTPLLRATVSQNTKIADISGNTQIVSEMQYLQYLNIGSGSPVAHASKKILVLVSTPVLNCALITIAGGPDQMSQMAYDAQREVASTAATRPVSFTYTGA
ncbi:MAG: hypothetical protein NT135_00470 [Candidatus Berkelbacteria bacterium]|nr:hypothetical protein [Candidatus Berkelbacteria bacterium]